MNLNILVTGSVYSSQSAYSALKFCHAAITQGHRITQVFFYRDAVSQASRLTVPLDDEFNCIDEWVAFAKGNDVPLVACVSAAERRGILNAEQADEFAKDADNVHPIFQIEGLGVLHDASLSSDRTVTFK